MFIFIIDLFFTIFCILDIVFRCVTQIDYTFYDFATYIIILAFIYYLHQLIRRGFYVKEAPEKREETISANNPQFIRDTIYRYLTAWVMGVFFIYELVDLMRQGFGKYKISDSANAKQVCAYLDKIFCSLVLPIELIIDACMVKRRRCPNLTCDLLVILGVLIVFLLMKILFWKRLRRAGDIFPEIANTFICCIFSFDGYIFMDWLLFKSNGGTGNYALFT
ncbi:MAG: hypothetical protein MJ252_25325 [archaeon]|nr:hypothetical protein [archaeon]